MSNFIEIIDNNQGSIMVFLLCSSLFFMFFTIYLYREIAKIKKREKVFFTGKDANNLEGVFLEQVERVNYLDKSVNALKEADEQIINTLSNALQKVGIVRFNPFGDVGGNQSFAAAFLDNHDSGVIILSLYSRDGVRIYGKPIENGKSEYKLSEEEEEAIKKAING